ncbi:hypothetical protein V1508DRAFT_407298 [Lipomyces doorenjongii]|uniref:uncharacterized protein n=1 Tax=Lipomyces doorenjongii TaxID=383834 RepID=UPI0034CE4423
MRKFIEAVSRAYTFDLAAQSLRIKATLSANMFMQTDVSTATCAQTGDRALQTRVAMLLSNEILDCTGYYFQSRRRIETKDQIKFSFTRNWTIHISFSKDDGSAVIVYYHRGHSETPKFHLTDKRYQNLTRMADDCQFKETGLSTVTTQQVYNVWLSIQKLSAQVLIGEQDGYQLVEDLQEPGVSLATPCFSDTLYCVLTEYYLVSLPPSYLLLDTRGIREDGKRGSRLIAWFTALLDAGLKPNVVHTDKDFAGG